MPHVFLYSQISFFFFWPHCLVCGTLVPWPGTETTGMAVKAPSPNHRTAREFPEFPCLNKAVISFIFSRVVCPQSSREQDGWAGDCVSASSSCEARHTASNTSLTEWWDSVSLCILWLTTGLGIPPKVHLLFYVTWFSRFLTHSLICSTNTESLHWSRDWGNSEKKKGGEEKGKKKCLPSGGKKLTSKSTVYHKV